ncbi:Clp protease/crotonase-like domain-containing protein [Geoglobus acetivorans]|uniref:Uncharacterized protein n=1 Tax=Geoglobus acetivorans TaxID=565033 RepID=A0A0A7GG60_GEOAI|nr:hypothetical protein GACE_0870 [Geoglobus acetivorans]
MARIFSFSVSEDKTQLIAILEKWSENKELSKNIVAILEGLYLTGNMNFNAKNVSDDFFKIVELEKKLIELKKQIAIINELEAEIREMKKKFEDMKNHTETHNNSRLIEILKNDVFDDINALRKKLNNGTSEYEKHEVVRFIKVRLTNFALENGLNYPEARNLFFKAFPDTEELLKNKI